MTVKVTCHYTDPNQTDWQIHWSYSLAEVLSTQAELCIGISPQFQVGKHNESWVSELPR